MEGEQVGGDGVKGQPYCREQAEDDKGIVEMREEGGDQIEFKEDVDEPEENDIRCCRAVE